MATSRKVLIFQLGSNNWQMDDEPAPTSGIFHESRHVAFNLLDNTVCYSLYPSRLYSSNPNHERVQVVKLGHAIPAFQSESASSPESVEPVVSWESMGDAEVEADLERFENACYSYIQEVEDREGCPITFALAHHTFASPIVLTRVMKRRVAEGQRAIPIISFGFGPALNEQLKLFGKEKHHVAGCTGRFYPMVQECGALSDGKTGVLAMVLTSDLDVTKFRMLFPEFPKQRIMVCPTCTSDADEKFTLEKQCAHIREKVLQLLDELEKDGMSNCQEAREKRIRERAYFRYEQTGCTNAEENYMEALKQVEEEERQASTSKSAPVIGGA